MSVFKSNRRTFIKTAAASGLMLSGAAPVFSAPASSATLSLRPQRKALVFIMLDGGNDSYNMLVPYSKKAYSEYQKTRGNLAIERNELLPLKGYKDQQKRQFALHPSMPEVQALFAQHKLSFVSNIGPLIEPVSKAQFYNQQARLPLGLLSHADQFKHWQTSRPDQRINHGWFGKFADILQRQRALSQIPMNISLAGSNIMQNGLHTRHYSITEKGSVGLIVNDEKSPLNTVLHENFNQLLNTAYPADPFKQTYLEQTREAHAQHTVFRAATENIHVATRFSDSDLSQQLKKVAQCIKAADRLNTPQQTFFVRYIGWDHHDELLNSHATMLRILSRALGEFQSALAQLGVDDQVVTFTGSDFGRTLTSNGNGSDHGWGGHTLVMGNPVQGGQIFGDYPSLALGDKNPLDAGDGVLIPTLATDQLYASLAEWFGASRSSLPTLFPNLKNFGSPLNIIG